MSCPCCPKVSQWVEGIKVVGELTHPKACDGAAMLPSHRLAVWHSGLESCWGQRLSFRKMVFVKLNFCKKFE